MSLAKTADLSAILSQRSKGNLLRSSCKRYMFTWSLPMQNYKMTSLSKTQIHNLRPKNSTSCFSKTFTHPIIFPNYRITSDISKVFVQDMTGVDHFDGLFSPPPEGELRQEPVIRQWEDHHGQQRSFKERQHQKRIFNMCDIVWYLSNVNGHMSIHIVITIEMKLTLQN